MPDLLDYVDRCLARPGVDTLARAAMGSLARFRRFELAAALDRLRTLKARP